MSNRSYSERLAVAVAATILVMWVRAFVYQVPNYNYADSFGPTLVELGELTLVPDSAVTWFYGGAPTVLPRLIAMGCRMLGVTPEWMHAAIAATTLVAGLLGLGLAAARIAGTAWAGTLAMIAIPFAWPFSLSVGYSAPFWTGYNTAGYWGLGWTCAVWGVWFASRPTGLSSIIPFALAGIEFLAHPTWAIVSLAVLGLGELFELIASSNRAATLRSVAIKIAIALLIASPQIAIIVGNLQQTVKPEDLVGWWPLIQFRKSFHYYLWDDVVTYGRFGVAALLMVLATIAVWPMLDATTRRRALATSTAVAMLIVMAYFVMEVVSIRALASLVLTRSGSLISAAAVVFIVAASVGSLSGHGVRGAAAAVLAWVAILAIAFPVEGVGYAPYAQRFSLQTPDVVRAIGNFSLSLLITVVALLALLITRHRSARAREQKALPVLALVVVTVLLMAKLPLIPALQGAALPTPTWNGLTTYLREQTPRDSLIVVPPYPYSIASARRSFVQDYSLLGAAVYNPPMTGFEMKVLRSLYDIELDGMSHDDIKQYLVRNDGILCLLERKYRALVASDARIREVKAAFPSTAFVVGFKPGVTPLEWSCGAYEGGVLPLPIAYENAEYVLYDVRQLNASPEKSTP